VPDGHDRWILHEVVNMRFNRFALPGEIVRLEAEADGERDADGAAWFRGRVEVDGEPVGRLRFALRETVKGRIDGGGAPH
jgi:3-hydroxymyristoyl/3-hydroxydecanoyl-(acyl carrier protein) dehydratase